MNVKATIHFFTLIDRSRLLGVLSLLTNWHAKCIYIVCIFTLWKVQVVPSLEALGLDKHDFETLNIYVVLPYRVGLQSGDIIDDECEL